MSAVAARDYVSCRSYTAACACDLKHQYFVLLYSLHSSTHYMVVSFYNILGFLLLLFCHIQFRYWQNAWPVRRCSTRSKRPLRVDWRKRRAATTRTRWRKFCTLKNKEKKNNNARVSRILFDAFTCNTPTLLTSCHHFRYWRTSRLPRLVGRD